MTREELLALGTAYLNAYRAYRALLDAARTLQEAGLDRAVDALMECMPAAREARESALDALCAATPNLTREGVHRLALNR